MCQLRNKLTFIKRFLFDFFDDKEIMLITIEAKHEEIPEIVDSLKVLKNARIARIIENENLERPVLTYETKLITNKMRWVLIICLMYFFVYMLNLLKIV